MQGNSFIFFTTSYKIKSKIRIYYVILQSQNVSKDQMFEFSIFVFYYDTGRDLDESGVSELCLSSQELREEVDRLIYSILKTELQFLIRNVDYN